MNVLYRVRCVDLLCAVSRKLVEHFYAIEIACDVELVKVDLYVDCRLAVANSATLH